MSEVDKVVAFLDQATLLRLRQAFKVAEKDRVAKQQPYRASSPAAAISNSEKTVDLLSRIKGRRARSLSEALRSRFKPR